MEKPLVNKKYLLEKYPGKGGWTYVIIPEIAQNKKNKFGWVKVKGTIDNFEIKGYKLMPMGQGRLFLPVRAEIRKIIKKKEGDFVTVTLYEDNDPLEIPEEFLVCLLDNPLAHQTFLSYTEGEQKAFVDWINEAKRIETKADRIAKSLDKLERKQKFYNK